MNGLRGVSSSIMEEGGCMVVLVVVVIVSLFIDMATKGN